MTGLTTYLAAKPSATLRARPAAYPRPALECSYSVPGVYGGLLDKILFGAAMNKGITFRMGQTHVPRYTKPLLEKIQSGAIDPSFVITHRVPLDDAPAAYKTFRDKEDGCIKVVLKP